MNQSANTRGGTSRTRRTADLRVTASTRIGAPPRGKSRPRRGGALARRVGALTQLIKKNGNARYFVAALQMERTNLPARS